MTKFYYWKVANFAIKLIPLLSFRPKGEIFGFNSKEEQH